MGEGSPTFGGRGGGGTKTQRIAMKFGMLVVGLGENHKSIDELAQTESFFFYPSRTLQTRRRLTSESDRFVLCLLRCPCVLLSCSDAGDGSGGQTVPLRCALAEGEFVDMGLLSLHCL